MEIRVQFFVAFFALLFILSGILTLPNYGLSWDEGLGNLFFGERYFRFFTSFNSIYLDFERDDLAIHQRPFNLFESAFRGPNEFPPAADTVSALAMEALAYRLRWMDPVDAFHLPKILLSGLLLWLLFRFAAPRLGVFAALTGITILGLYPRFWGDMHFNPKDIPITALFAFVLMAFAAWYERPSLARAVGVGLLAGIALSIKANALFLPLVIVLGIWPWEWKWPPWGRIAAHLRRQFGAYLLMAATAVAVHVLSWPYLYADPVNRLLQYYNFIFTQGGRVGSGSWNLDPLVQALTTMPEAVLALFIAGLAAAVLRLARREPAPFLRLLLAWTAVPVLRASLPNAVNFDGIRHFEEFLPAACLLAGYGASQTVDLLSRRRPAGKAAAQFALAALLLANFAFVHLRYFPYQHTYYNTLVNGLYGAHYQEKFPEATDYWATSYRQGMAWLNAHADREANVAVPVAGWNVRLTDRLWLRSDLRYIVERRVRPALNDGSVVYMMFINREEFFTPFARSCFEELEPVYQIEVDRVPVLLIYRLDGTNAYVLG